MSTKQNSLNQNIIRGKKIYMSVVLHVPINKETDYLRKFFKYRIRCSSFYSIYRIRVRNDRATSSYLLKLIFNDRFILCLILQWSSVEFYLFFFINKACI